MDSEVSEKRGRGGRGVEFCCLSYPLVKAGAYLIPIEFGFVAGCIIVLSTTTPTIVAAVDTLPHIFSLVLLILAIITLAWQVIGLATVRIEMSSIYRLYIRLNFLLVLITAATAAIGTVVIATKHKQSTEVCTRIYGNPPLNSSNGVSVPGLDSFAPGEHICNYVMWAQTAAMGGLTLILFLTQVCCSKIAPTRLQTDGLTHGEAGYANRRTCAMFSALMAKSSVMHCSSCSITMRKSKWAPVSLRPVMIQADDPLGCFQQRGRRHFVSRPDWRATCKLPL